MKEFVSFLILVFICVSACQANAQHEEWRQASAVCPSVGIPNKVLIMVPGDHSGTQPNGKFYEIGREGQLTVRWEVNWYSDANDVFIANDYLIRIRKLKIESGVKDEKLRERPLLEFYEKGVMKKQYKVGDLGDIGANFGLTSFPAENYSVFAVKEQLAPRIVRQLQYEVNTLDQYRKIMDKAEDPENIFMVDVIGGDRIFFKISTGEILDRFRFNFIDKSVFD